MIDWEPRYKAHIEGRDVELWQYRYGGELRVITTQAGTQIVSGSLEAGSIVMPSVISDGDRLEIEATTADDLVARLLANGFSEREAKEIARHGRAPGT